MVDTQQWRSSSSRVHLQVGIFTEPIDLDQSLFAQPQTLQILAFFSAAIRALLPHGGDRGSDLLA